MFVLSALNCGPPVLFLQQVNTLGCFRSLTQKVINSDSKFSLISKIESKLLQYVFRIGDQHGGNHALSKIGKFQNFWFFDFLIVDDYSLDFFHAQPQEILTKAFNRLLIRIAQLPLIESIKIIAFPESAGFSSLDTLLNQVRANFDPTVQPSEDLTLLIVFLEESYKMFDSMFFKTPTSNGFSLSKSYGFLSSGSPKPKEGSPLIFREDACSANFNSYVSDSVFETKTATFFS